MKKYLFIFFLFVVSQLTAQSNTVKYYNHLIFRETPYSKTEGRIQLTEEESQNTNHFKLSYDTSNRLILVEYLYKTHHIELNRSGLLDGARELAPKTKIEYIDNKEIRTFFNVKGESTTNRMGVFKEVYSYNNNGKRVSLKFYDENDKPVNSSWKISEYQWKHIDNTTVLEKRKNSRGSYVSLRPYYKFHNVLYKFNANGILVSMSNVDEKLNLINDKTGIAIDRAIYDEHNNLVRFNFFNADNKPTIGSFLGTAGGIVIYDNNGNCIKYATIGLDGNYMLDKIRSCAYTSYKFDTYGNLIERFHYDLNNTITKKRGVNSVKYIYNQDNPIELLRTESYNVNHDKKNKD